MYPDYNQYLQWLHSCLQAQDQRIMALERMIQQLSTELKQLKEKPAIHVDRIDYKFDQLKVETLEGTLNIGLNPSDLQGIEDFAVNNQDVIPPLSPKDQMMRSMEIEEAILNYLETDLPDIVANVQKNLNIQPNESYLSFIKEDIKKQLPSRIDSHLKASSPNDHSEESIKATNEKIIQLIKQEIQNGVSVFFDHLPKNMKGMNPE